MMIDARGIISDPLCHDACIYHHLGIRGSYLPLSKVEVKTLSIPNENKMYNALEACAPLYPFFTQNNSLYIRWKEALGGNSLVNTI